MNTNGQVQLAWFGGFTGVQDVAVLLILVAALLSMAVDAFSRNLRRRLRIDSMPTRLSEAPGEARMGGSIGEGRLACKA